MAEVDTSGIRRFIHSSPTNLAIFSSCAGMLRSLLATPLQHPMDTLKVNYQINNNLKNEFEVVKYIYTERGGMKGFYYGLSANLTKQIFKSSYRYPLLSGLPRFYAGMFGSKYEDNKYIMRLLTSLTIAFTEATLITPIERLQVFLMTSKFSDSNYKDFFTMIKSRARKEIFKGYSPYILKQCVSWTVFLQADQFYKNRMRSMFNIHERRMITGWKLAACGLMTSLTTVFSIMPFDNIKTFLQKHNIEVKDGHRVKCNENQFTIKNAVKGIYAKRGIRGFYVGWRIRILVNFFNSSFTVVLLEWIDDLARDC
ncbi:unnamed protein product [Moneuplotes crassus]|uniref:Mitochondrial carrier protein n=1 Tax=Euplotes crassus TaxID=5936 RepID=A0AAD1UH39_EUPCR|nr:unnamed protein product [Moneuplotes crassus]